MIDVARENKKLIQRARQHHREAQLDVLFAARPNLFTQPGGDTEVVIMLKRALARQGCCIDFRPMPQAGRTYGIVHIFNCDTPIAIECALQQVPYVVTPLYEDFDRYFLRSMRTVSYFRNYLQTGDGVVLEEKLSALGRGGEEPAASDRGFVLRNAAAVCATGSYEEVRIRRDFPEVRHTELIPVGFCRPPQAEEVSPDLFIREYGVRDFILCVGRLESRKNQLMLLYSLRDEDLPLVFVDSSSVQPEYERMCRAMRRKGKTVFTGRIPPAMLQSAYRAARVHALPSWYELPGLVSLDAAWFGCRVVAPDWGTLRDYLGDTVFYCSPFDPASIRGAVLEAWDSAPNDRARHLLAACSWEDPADRLSRLYRRLRQESGSREGREFLRETAENARREVSYHRARGQAVETLRMDFGRGLQLLDRLVDSRPDDPINYLLRGETRLRQSRFAEAERDLARSIKLMKSRQEGAYLLLSLALIQQGKRDAARSLLREAEEIFPFMNPGTKDIIADYLRRCDASA